MSDVEKKYVENCALCNTSPTEVKWAGRFWHVKCKRKSKKLVKGMF
ncbi:MAG: hypothetical protein Q7K42_02930 [Candidatus Diapherotrites archaeon]|nr:hypothetical protein [Candidatus Diapherotrites archaeon]